MIKRTLGQIAEMAGGQCAPAFAQIAVEGVSTDTRKIQKRNVYIPLSGERFDGHDFAKEALQAGASACFWEKGKPHPPEGAPIVFVDSALKALQSLAAAYREQLPTKIVAVTGSNGKTTTKDLAAAAFASIFKTKKTNKNFNNHIGLPLTLLDLDEDTEIAVVEMGMSARGEIRELSLIARPDAAIITVIGESHLAQLKSREEIAEAKLEILDGLKEGGLLICNGDEPLLRREHPFKTVYFGLGGSCNETVEGARPKSGGTEFYVGEEIYWIPLFGKHNALNALAAIIAAKAFGVPEKRIQNALSVAETTGMRSEMAGGKGGIEIVNDAYNASPTSVRAALDTLKGMGTFRKRIVVLGDMLELGKQEKELHREIGEEMSAEDFSRVFTYGILAREIAEAAKARFPEGAVRHFESKESLAKTVLSEADSGDIVLVKGSRGMKMEEIVSYLS